MKYFYEFVRMSLALAVSIILPQTHITTIMATLHNHTLESFQKNALFMLIVTIFLDTINSIPLGTTAFAWLLMIMVFFICRVAIETIYHPSIPLIQKGGQVLSLVCAVILHQALIGLLIGLPYMPSLTEVLLMTVTSSCLLWLTRIPSI